MDIILINAVPFVLALLMALPATRQTLKQTGLTWLTAGTMAVLFFWLLTFIPKVHDNEVIIHSYEWSADLGLMLTWYLDGLSLMFALIVTGVGIVVFLYAGYYFDDDVQLAKFYGFLAAFSGSMLALVLAGNVFMLFIAWEGTSVMSFMLIGFKGNKDENARTSASRALIITGGGGLALFVGLMLLGVAVNQANGINLFAEGGFQLETILQADVRSHGWYEAFTFLILMGAFTKSAQFPFHFWLPGAMTAPSPASAYLHSATMVKAGVYLLFRLYPTLGKTNYWEGWLVTIGLTTMFIGALFAIRKRDLKGLLAYSTVSKLGAIVAMIGLPDSIGIKAAAVGILAHAMYKATFFLLAGTIEHSTGTRNLDELGGLRKRLPISFYTAVLVGLSMAGFPPLLGFVAKETLLDAMLPEHGLSIVLIVVVTAASILTVAAAFLFIWDVFVSRPDQTYDHFHAPPMGIHVGPAILAGMSLITGVLIAPLLDPIVSAAIGKEVHLHLFPENLNPFENHAFGLSLLVLITGPLLFAVRRYWLKMPWFNLPSGLDIYAGFIHSVEWVGDQLLKTQNGKLRYYLVVILGVVSGLMLFGGTHDLSAVTIKIDIEDAADVVKVMMLILALGSTAASIILRQHLLAALSLGISGYAIGGLFLLEPAPDVALVQFLVETLATVLIILMVARISMRQRQEVMRTLWLGARDGQMGVYRDVAIAVIIGLSVGAFALAAVDDRESRLETLEVVDSEVVGEAINIPEFVRPIAVWHLENSYKETEATDVVAAILADFRGTDTLLEISVFSMAALGVMSLLAVPKGREILIGKDVRSVMKNVAQSQEISRRQNDGGDPLATDELNQIRSREYPLPDRRDQYGAYGDEHGISRLSTPLTRMTVTLVLPFALLISISHVLYGGSAPGDGFTAGVVSGLAIAVWYVVFGYYETKARLWWLRPGRLISIGLSIALGNAVAGMIFADGFLNIMRIDAHAPAGLHLVSTIIFDFAIFLTVFGGVTAIMEAIAHPGEEEV